MQHVLMSRVDWINSQAHNTTVHVIKSLWRIVSLPAYQPDKRQVKLLQLLEGPAGSQA
jgi:hypothetical protein